MTIIARLSCVLAFAIPLATAAILPARAQESPLDPAAAQMADAISHSKQKTVVVLDFAGPAYEVTALGRHLADNFSAALAKLGGQFTVEDRGQVVEALQRKHLAPEIVRDPEGTLHFARDLKAKAFIFGELTFPSDDELPLTVYSYRTSDGKAIKGLTVTLHLTEEMKRLMAQTYTAPTSYPDANQNGYSSPSCLFCPSPDYSSTASQAKFEGVVVLQVVVKEDGSISVVSVVKGLPYGLTANAIEAVKRWKLKPATGPDGKPVAVREKIQVFFRLY